MASGSWCGRPASRRGPTPHRRERVSRRPRRRRCGRYAAAEARLLRAHASATSGASMHYLEFLGHVQERAGLDSRGAAERAVRATFETLAERVTQGATTNLA